MILRWIAHRFMSRFEKRFDYDMGYAHALLDTSWRAFIHYVVTGAAAAHRGRIPLDAWYATKIVAARVEDCGPCVQLVMNMAEAEGVPAAVRHAVWHRDAAAMSEDVRLAWRYAEAAVNRSPDIGEWCEAIERRWGRKGLTSLALSMTTSRTFPALKYALGHGQTCRAVCIDGHTFANQITPAATEQASTLVSAAPGMSAHG
jgi:hypothetical protein